MPGRPPRPGFPALIPSYRDPRVQHFWPSPAAHSVVASGFAFPDALGQGPYRLPIHLVRRDSLDGVIKADIRRLDPSRIDVVGGTAVIGPSAVEQLRELGP